MEQCIDKKILLQLHHGDMKAFEFVYHHYVGRIYNFILSIVKDEVTSKDLTQDLFCRYGIKEKTLIVMTTLKGIYFAFAEIWYIIISDVNYCHKAI